MTLAKSYAVSTTFTVGGDIGLSIGALALAGSFSYSETTETGTSLESQGICGVTGGNYVCGLKIYPDCTGVYSVAAKYKLEAITDYEQ